jgi:hypothetical protein
LANFVLGAFDHFRRGAGEVAFFLGGAHRFTQFTNEGIGLFLNRACLVVLASLFQLAGFPHQRFHLRFRFGRNVASRFIGANRARFGQRKQQSGDTERPAMTNQRG